MKYEIVESAGQWIVRREGGEVARFCEQGLALAHVASRLKVEAGDGPASLSMRYERRAV